MSTRHILEMLCLAAIWGISFIFMRIAAPEFGAVVLIEIRLLIASLFLVPIWWVRESTQVKAVAAQNWLPIFIVGVINSAIPFSLFAFAALYIDASFSSIINSTAPIWGALVAWVWLGQRLTKNSILGLIIGVLGVYVLVSGSISWSFESDMTKGIAAALCATLLYGIAANYISVKLKQVSSLSVATWSLVAGAIFLAPFALADLPENDVSSKAWLAVIAMGLVSTGIANIFYFRLLSAVGPSKAITVAFLIPLFGMFWGALILNESITLIMLAGAATILLGTALTTGVVKLFQTSVLDSSSSQRR